MSAVIRISVRTVRDRCKRCDIPGNYYWAEVQSTQTKVLLDQGPLNMGPEFVGKPVPASTIHKCFRSEV